MTDPLQQAWIESGAVLDESGSSPQHFGSPQAELEAALRRAVICDRSHLTRLVGTGKDLLDLLHRLSTATIVGLAEGQGRSTVLTSPKGRIVERLFVHHLGASGVLLIGGPDSTERVTKHLARYTFSEQLGLSDESRSTAQFAVLGPDAAAVLEAAGWGPVDGHDLRRVEFADDRAWLLGGDGQSDEGFSVVVQADRAAGAWRHLATAAERAGGRAAGIRAAESYRVLRGTPTGPNELNDDYNPLEAGLRGSVAFDKGCYVGQEVVARLDSYGKVSRGLYGLEFGAAAPLLEPQCSLFVDGRAVGRVTSVVGLPGRESFVGLAFVKRKAAVVGAELQVGSPDSDLVARLVELPFERETQRC